MQDMKEYIIIFCNPIAIFKKLCYNTSKEHPCPEIGRFTAGQTLSR